MKELNLDLTMLGRQLTDEGLRYGFRTADGDEYWVPKYQLHMMMGRVTRVRVYHYLRDWEKEQEKTELTSYEDFKEMLATKNWPEGFDPGYIPYQ